SLRDGFEYIRPKPRLANDFYSVRSKRVPLIYDLSRTIRVRTTRIRRAPERIDIHSRRNLLIRRNPLPLFHHPLRVTVAIIERADRCHTVTQIKFVDVIRGNFLVEIDVRMQIDQ